MYCIKCGKKNYDDHEYCIFCGGKLTDSKIPVSSKELNKAKINSSNIAKILVVIFLLVIAGTITITNLSRVTPTSNSSTNNNTSERLDTKKEIDNTGTVVQVLCDKAGGSGTMMTEDGLILTNYHVIKGATSCLVTIPDKLTGEPVEIYYAKTIIVPKLSNLYDIATLEIDGVYTDEDGKTWGTYPNKFTFFQRPESCSTNPWKLGEPIKIYGYPATSHNYNLTITEGIISNFSDGYILTSAKIDSGNSGGLAVNQEGCMVGIPSAVLEGNYQNLGVIIPSELIVEFLNEASDQLSSNDTTSQENQINNKPMLVPSTKIESESPTSEINKSSSQWVGTFCPNPVEMINITSLEALGGGKVRISWTPLAHSASSYSIFHSTSANGFTLLTSSGSSGLTEIGGLTVNTNHYFLVQFDWYEGSNHICATSYSKSILVK